MAGKTITITVGDDRVAAWFDGTYSEQYGLDTEIPERVRSGITRITYLCDQLVAQGHSEDDIKIVFA